MLEKCDENDTHMTVIHMTVLKPDGSERQSDDRGMHAALHAYVHK